MIKDHKGMRYPPSLMFRSILYIGDRVRHLFVSYRKLYFFHTIIVINYSGIGHF